MDTCKIRREKVDRELDTLEVQLQGLGKCSGSLCLAGARHILEQYVSAGQKCNHKKPDLIVFAYDDFVYVADDLRSGIFRRGVLCT